MSFLTYPREEWVTNGSEKGGDNHNRWQSSRSRRRNNKKQTQPKETVNSYQNAKQDNYPSRLEKSGTSSPRFDKSRGVLFDRPKWIPPKQSVEPIPQPDCPWCGKPVKDMEVAVQDRKSGEAVHFDCVVNSLTQSEVLEKGDSISYIGGGRFGLVHFGSSLNSRKFVIKKIIEWEEKNSRAKWRVLISDHFSMT